MAIGGRFSGNPYIDGLAAIGWTMVVGGDHHITYYFDDSRVRLWDAVMISRYEAAPQQWANVANITTQRVFSPNGRGDAAADRIGQRRSGVEPVRMAKAQRPHLPALQDNRNRQRSAAAILPPSTGVTSPVVFSSSAWCRKAWATSSAVTSRPSRLPLM